MSPGAGELERPLAARAARPESRGSPRARAAAVLGLAAALLFALAAWLFLPRASDAEPRVALDAVLVDASASVVRAPEWLPWARLELARAARAAEARGAELVVLVYGDGVATGFAPGPPARFLERLEGRAGAPFDPAAGPGRGATELAAALAALEPLVDTARHRPGVLTLLAPARGAWTGASPAGPLARLASAGVALERREPPADAACDLALLELALPPRVEPGSELVALARFRLVRPAGAACTAAELVLEVEGELGTRRLTRAIALPETDGDFELPVACGLAGAGRTRVSARCRLTDAGEPDRMPENDAAVAATRADGTRVVGVAVRDELAAAAGAWLAPAGRSALAGLQFVFLSPAALAGELAELDAVVSFDVAPRELPGPLLEAFVLRGGGWLAVSGWGLLADWTPGEEGGALARLLPCAPAEAEIPPRDVVLLVDGSGSMEGEPFETVRAAAAELVGAALPGDRVSLRFFTVALEREHVLKERAATRVEDQDAAQRVARELLQLRVPRGMTFLLASLAELARSTGEHETLALLLTDGWERDALSDERGTAVRVAGELARASVRLVVVAVGRANLELLGVLAGGAERVQRGDTLDDLRAIFHRELFRAQIAEAAPLALAPRPPGSLAAEVASAAPRGLALPPVERYVRNRLRPGAEALWVSARDTDGAPGPDDPVLALARAGAGRTALFASRPTDGWAPLYARVGPGEPAEFDGLLRWLARGPEREPPARARLTGGDLVVTGLPAGTPPEIGATLAELRSPGREVPLVLAAAGGAGRDALTTRVGRVPGVAELGPVALRLPASAGGLALAVERELAPELARAERDLHPEWLAPDAAGPARPDPARTAAAGSHPAAPLTLWLALVLLLLAGLAAGRGPGRAGGPVAPGDQGIPGSGR